NERFIGTPGSIRAVRANESAGNSAATLPATLLPPHKPLVSRHLVFRWREEAHTPSLNLTKL
ncbi:MULTISPECIES: hypothetical protein, partial [Enorma]|uniref:hypothetical protein n=1 Tax=Enorma TaxID=1472762 RepID=UPI001CA35656